MYSTKFAGHKNTRAKIDTHIDKNHKIDRKPEHTDHM